MLSTYSKKEATHAYQSKDGDILIAGSFQECEDARIWHQFRGYTVQSITTI